MRVSVTLNCPGKARLYSHSWFHVSEILNSPGKVDKFTVHREQKQVVARKTDYNET